MTPASDRQYFVIAIGWTALLAHLVILGQFLYGFRPEAFWSFKWIISIVFMFGLFGAAVGLLNLGGSTRTSRVIVSVFGSAFLVAAIVLYCYWAYSQSTGGLDLVRYSGFLVLFGALIGVAVACIATISKDYLRFPSYGFGIADLLFLFRLIQKYIFGAEQARLGTFLGEILLLLLGAIFFLALYFGSEERAEAAGPPRDPEAERGW
jgi:hypothetical protein